MAQAKQGDTVKVHYTGKLSNGEVFDSSRQRDPLQFTLGTGQLIAGFEEGVMGMEPGQNKTVNIPSAKGYGPKQDALIVAVPKDKLPTGIEPHVGQRLQVQQQNGDAVPVVITSVDDITVTIDANHPLAGEDLVFDIELLEILS